VAQYLPAEALAKEGAYSAHDTLRPPSTAMGDAPTPGGIPTKSSSAGNGKQRAADDFVRAAAVSRDAILKHGANVARLSSSNDRNAMIDELIPGFCTLIAAGGAVDYAPKSRDQLPSLEFTGFLYCVGYSPKLSNESIASRLNAKDCDSIMVARDEFGNACVDITLKNPINTPSAKTSFIRIWLRKDVNSIIEFEALCEMFGVSEGSLDISSDAVSATLRPIILSGDFLVGGVDLTVREEDIHSYYFHRVLGSMPTSGHYTVMRAGLLGYARVPLPIDPAAATATDPRSVIADLLKQPEAPETAMPTSDAVVGEEDFEDKKKSIDVAVDLIRSMLRSPDERYSGTRDIRIWRLGTAAVEGDGTYPQCSSLLAAEEIGAVPLFSAGVMTDFFEGDENIDSISIATRREGSGTPPALTIRTKNPLREEMSSDQERSEFFVFIKASNGKNSVVKNEAQVFQYADYASYRRAQPLHRKGLALFGAASIMTEPEWQRWRRTEIIRLAREGKLLISGTYWFPTLDSILEFVNNMDNLTDEPITEEQREAYRLTALYYYDPNAYQVRNRFFRDATNGVHCGGLSMSRSESGEPVLFVDNSFDAFSAFDRFGCNEHMSFSELAATLERIQTVAGIEHRVIDEIEVLPGREDYPPAIRIRFADNIKFALSPNEQDIYLFFVDPQTRELLRELPADFQNLQEELRAFDHTDGTGQDPWNRVLGAIRQGRMATNLPQVIRDWDRFESSMLRVATQVERERFRAVAFDTLMPGALLTRDLVLPIYNPTRIQVILNREDLYRLLDEAYAQGAFNVRGHENLKEPFVGKVQATLVNYHGEIKTEEVISLTVECSYASAHPEVTRLPASNSHMMVIRMNSTGNLDATAKFYRKPPEGALPDEYYQRRIDAVDALCDRLLVNSGSPLSLLYREYASRFEEVEPDSAEPLIKEAVEAYYKFAQRELAEIFSMPKMLEIITSYILSEGQDLRENYASSEDFERFHNSVLMCIRHSIFMHRFTMATSYLHSLRGVEIADENGAAIEVEHMPIGPIERLIDQLARRYGLSPGSEMHRRLFMLVHYMLRYENGRAILDRCPELISFLTGVNASGALVSDEDFEVFLSAFSINQQRWQQAVTAGFSYNYFVEEGVARHNNLVIAESLGLLVEGADQPIRQVMQRVQNQFANYTGRVTGNCDPEAVLRVLDSLNQDGFPSSAIDLVEESLRQIVGFQIKDIRREKYLRSVFGEEIIIAIFGALLYTKKGLEGYREEVERILKKEAPAERLTDIQAIIATDGRKGFLLDGLRGGTSKKWSKLAAKVSNKGPLRAGKGTESAMQRLLAEKSRVYGRAIDAIDRALDITGKVRSRIAGDDEGGVEGLLVAAHQSLDRLHRHLETKAQQRLMPQTLEEFLASQIRHEVERARTVCSSLIEGRNDVIAVVLDQAHREGWGADRVEKALDDYSHAVAEVDAAKEKAGAALRAPNETAREDALSELDALSALTENADSAMFEGASRLLEDQITEHRELLLRSARQNERRAREVEAGVVRFMVVASNSPIDVDSTDDETDGILDAIEGNLAALSGEGISGATKKRLSDELARVRAARERAESLLESISGVDSLKSWLELESEIMGTARDMRFSVANVQEEQEAEAAEGDATPKTSSAGTNLNTAFLNQAQRLLSDRLKTLVSEKLSAIEVPRECHTLLASARDTLGRAGNLPEKDRLAASLETLLQERLRKIEEDEAALAEASAKHGELVAKKDDIISNKDIEDMVDFTAEIISVEVNLSDVTLEHKKQEPLAEVNALHREVLEVFHALSDQVEKQARAVSSMIDALKREIGNASTPERIEKLLEQEEAIRAEIAKIRSRDKRRELSERLDNVVADGRETARLLRATAEESEREISQIHTRIETALKDIGNYDIEDLERLLAEAKAKDKVIDKIQVKQTRKPLRSTQRRLIHELETAMSRMRETIRQNGTEVDTALSGISRVLNLELGSTNIEQLRRLLEKANDFFAKCQDGARERFMPSKRDRSNAREAIETASSLLELAISVKEEAVQGQETGLRQEIEGLKSGLSEEGNPDLEDIREAQEAVNAQELSEQISAIDSNDAQERLRTLRDQTRSWLAERQVAVEVTIQAAAEAISLYQSEFETKVRDAIFIEDMPSIDDVEERLMSDLAKVPSRKERGDLKTGGTGGIAGAIALARQKQETLEETIREGKEETGQAIARIRKRLEKADELEALQALQKQAESIDQEHIKPVMSRNVREELRSSVQTLTEEIAEKIKHEEAQQQEEDAIRATINGLSAQIRDLVRDQDGAGFMAIGKEVPGINSRIEALSARRQAALAKDSQGLVSMVRVVTKAFDIIRKIKAAESQMQRTEAGGDLSSLADTLSSLEPEIVGLEDDQIRSHVEAIYKSALGALNGKHFSATRDEAVEGLRRHADGHIRMLAGWNVDRGQDGLVQRAIGEGKQVETLLAETKMAKDMEAWLGVLSSAPAEDEEARQLLGQFKQRFEDAKARKAAHAEASLRIARADQEVAAAWQDADALDRIEKRLLESNLPKAAWDLVPYGAQQSLSRKESALLRRIRDRKRDLGRGNGSAPAPAVDTSGRESALDSRDGRQHVPRGRQHGRASAEGVFAALDQLGLGDVPAGLEADEEPEHVSHGPKTAGRKKMSVDQMVRELQSDPPDPGLYREVKSKVEKAMRKGNFNFTHADQMIRIAREIAPEDEAFWSDFKKRRAEWIAAKDAKQGKGGKRGSKSSSAGFNIASMIPVAQAVTEEAERAVSFWEGSGPIFVLLAGVAVITAFIPIYLRFFQGRVFSLFYNDEPIEIITVELKRDDEWVERARRAERIGKMLDGYKATVDVAVGGVEELSYQVDREGIATEVDPFDGMSKEEREHTEAVLAALPKEHRARAIEMMKSEKRGAGDRSTRHQGEVLDEFLKQAEHDVGIMRGETPESRKSSSAGFRKTLKSIAGLPRAVSNLPKWAKKTIGITTTLYVGALIFWPIGTLMFTAITASVVTLFIVGLLDNKLDEERSRALDGLEESPDLFDEDGSIDPFSRVLGSTPIIPLVGLDSALPIAGLSGIIPAMKTNSWIIVSTVFISLFLISLIVNAIRISRLKKKLRMQERDAKHDAEALKEQLSETERSLVSAILRYINMRNIEGVKQFLIQRPEIQRAVFDSSRLDERTRRWLEQVVSDPTTLPERRVELGLVAHEPVIEGELLCESRKARNAAEEQVTDGFQLRIDRGKGNKPYLIEVSPDELLLQVRLKSAQEVTFGPIDIESGKEYYIGKDPKALHEHEHSAAVLDDDQYIDLPDSAGVISHLHCILTITQEGEEIWVRIENRSGNGTWIEYMPVVRHGFDSLTIKKKEAKAPAKSLSAQHGDASGKRHRIRVPASGLKAGTGAPAGKKKIVRRKGKQGKQGKSSSAGFVMPVVVLGVLGAIAAGVVFVAKRIRQKPKDILDQEISINEALSFTVRRTIALLGDSHKRKFEYGCAAYEAASQEQKDVILSALSREDIERLAKNQRKSVSVQTENKEKLLAGGENSILEPIQGRVVIHLAKADSSLPVFTLDLADEEDRIASLSLSAGDIDYDIEDGIVYSIRRFRTGMNPEGFYLEEEGLVVIPIDADSMPGNSEFFTFSVSRRENRIWLELRDDQSDTGTKVSYVRFIGYKLVDRAEAGEQATPAGSAVTLKAGKAIREGAPSLGKAVPPPVVKIASPSLGSARDRPARNDKGTKSSSSGEAKFGAVNRELSGELAGKISSSGQSKEAEEPLIDEFYQGERPIGHKPTDFLYTVDAIIVQEKGMNLRYMADRITEQAKRRPEERIRVVLSRHYWTDRDNGLQETLQGLVDTQLSDTDKKVEIVLSGISRQGTAIGVVAHSRFVLDDGMPEEDAIGVYVNGREIEVGVVDQEKMMIKGRAVIFELKDNESITDQIRSAIRYIRDGEVGSVAIAMQDGSTEAIFDDIKDDLEKDFKMPVSIFNCNRAEALSSAEIISGTGYGFSMIFRAGLEDANATLSIVENAAITSFNAISEDTVIAADGWVVRRVYDGHINQTYELTNKETREKYIIQNLNTIFDIDAEDNNLPIFEVSQDNSLKRGILPPGWQKSEYLNVKGAEPASKIYYDARGNAWRVMRYIKGQIFQVFDDVPDADKEDVARELGRAAALFPMICAQAPEGSRWADPLPGFHNADYHYRDYLLELLKNKRIPKSLSRDGKEMVQLDPEIMARYADQIGPLTEEIRSREALVDCLKKAGEGITHADLKLNNLVFKRDRDGRLRLIGFIDLDTIRPGNKMDDIGDILRYAGPVAGESPKNADGEYDVSQVVLDNNVVADIAVGFLKAIEEFQGPEEAERLKPLVLKAFEQYLWVQAIRFFADGLVGNRYFHLKPGEPEDFNIFRGAVQMQGLKLLEEQRENILRLIDEKMKSSSAGQSVQLIVDFAIQEGYVNDQAKVVAINTIGDTLPQGVFSCPTTKSYGLTSITRNNVAQAMKGILDVAAKEGPDRDLLDSKIMGIVTPTQEWVQQRAEEIFKAEGLGGVIDFLTKLSLDLRYVRPENEEKNRFLEPMQIGDYGVDFVVGIILSKPEIIAGQKQPEKYKGCPICFDRIGAQSRENLRAFELVLNGREFFVFLPPYPYYPRHSNLTVKQEEKQVLTDKVFFDLAAVVQEDNEVCAYSNSDRDGTGASVLGHSHYPIGMELPIFSSSKRADFQSAEEGIEVELLHYPATTIRVTGEDAKLVAEKAARVYRAWKSFSSDKIKPENNTAGLACRFNRETGKYEFLILLRNSQEEFLTDKKRHNIKKEFVGIIEMSGWAVFPGRLLKEMDQAADIIYKNLFEGIPIDSQIGDDQEMLRHSEFISELAENIRSKIFPGSYEHDAAMEIIRGYINAKIYETFVEIIRDNSPFKEDDTEALKEVFDFLVKNSKDQGENIADLSLGLKPHSPAAPVEAERSVTRVLIDSAA